MPEIMGLISILLILFYVICVILVPVATCRIWHWSYECFQELRDLNDVLSSKKNDGTLNEPDPQTVEEFAAQVNRRTIPQSPKEFAIRGQQMQQICDCERRENENIQTDSK